MSRWNAGGTELQLEAEIEIRRVYSHKQRGWLGQKMFRKLAPYTGDFQVMSQDFDVAPYRQFFHRVQRIQARGLHAGPADADETGLRQARPKRPDQVGAQQIA